MSNIGPQLPPHLQHLISSSREDDDDDSDDETGPQLPPGFGGSAPKDEAEEGSGQSAGIGPSIPSHLLNPSQTQGRSTAQQLLPQSRPLSPPRPARAIAQAEAGPSTGRKVIGPVLPNYGPTYNPNTFGNIEDDDDSDDDVGPKPLPAGMQHQESNAVQEFLEREERMRKNREEAAAKSNAPKREEWMLVPPTNSDLLGNLDPTKLKKGRQFAKSSGSAVGGPSDMSLWTETPQERQQRLEDEVLGRKRRAVDIAHAGAVDDDPEKKRRKREEAVIKKGVDEYNKRLRGPSLIDQHASASDAKKKDEDEGPPVIWDHSRDMGLGGRLMDDDKRKQMLREAKGLGDRFSSGQSGGFL